MDNPVLGSLKNVGDYSIINYKKSPFIIYKNFFNEQVCTNIINQYANGTWKEVDNHRGQFLTLEFEQNFHRETYESIVTNLDKIAKDANKNFMLDIMHIESLHLMKFEETHYYDWHHDCDWWYNDLPYDNKLTLLMILENNCEGGEIEEFQSTVKISSAFFETSSVYVLPSYFFYKINPIIKGQRTILYANVIGPKFK